MFIGYNYFLIIRCASCILESCACDTDHTSWPLSRLGFLGSQRVWGWGGLKVPPCIISLLFNELQRNLEGLVIGW